MKTIYLSGGTRTDWRSGVKDSVPGFRYFDPCELGLDDPAQYTIWDLSAVKESDFVFAYLEADNPSGYGLALEVGYAVALNKLVIFVDEKSASDNQVAEQLAIVKHCASVTLNSLGAGAQLLKSLQKVYT